MNISGRSRITVLHHGTILMTDFISTPLYSLGNSEIRFVEFIPRFRSRFDVMTSPELYSGILLTFTVPARLAMSFLDSMSALIVGPAETKWWLTLQLPRGSIDFFRFLYRSERMFIEISVDLQFNLRIAKWISFVVSQRNICYPFNHC